MRKNITTLSGSAILLVMIMVSGCSTAKPYPHKDIKSSIISGYLSENGHTTAGEKENNSGCLAGDCNDNAIPSMNKTNYEKERDHLLTKIVKTPPVPMRAPDTILRVLVLPYVDDFGALTAHSYKFVKVDDGKWILGEHLAKEGDGIRMLTPLKSDLITEENRQSSEVNNQQQSAPAQQNQMYQPNIMPRMEH